MRDQDWVTAVEGDEVVFRLADPTARLTGVRPGEGPESCPVRIEFGRVAGGWELRIPRPPLLDRMEYMFELPRTATVTDPSNPRTVDGAFGEQSWRCSAIHAAVVASTSSRCPRRLEPMPVTGTPLGHVEMQIWSPADADPGEPLPLLVAHDGPEFALRRARRTTWRRWSPARSCPGCGSRCSVRARAERLVLRRLDYAAALVRLVLPAVTRRLRVTRRDRC